MVELIADVISVLLVGRGGEEVGGADDGEPVEDVGGALEYELPVSVDESLLLSGVVG